MSGRRGAAVDAVLYAGCGAVAASTAAWASIPLYRDWGRDAWIAYATGAVLAAAVASAAPALGRRALGLRGAVCALVVAGAGLAPMAGEVVARSHASAGLHAQSEVIVTEEAARALLDGRNPYAASYADGPLVARPPAVQEHFPYLPGMIAFGLPRALGGESALADARLWFAAAALAAAGCALWVVRADARRALRALQALFVVPTGAALFAGGAHVLPVVALMLLSVSLLHRRRVVASGIAAGAAASLMQLALPLVPFAVLAARDAEGRRAAGRWLAGCAAVAVPVSLVFFAWDPGAFVEDAVQYPLGTGEQASVAQGPSLLRPLLDAFPSARGALVVAFVVGLVGWIAWRAGRRAPASAADVAREAGVLLLLAVILAPAARLGYWIFPIGLLAWAWLLGPKRAGQCLVSRHSSALSRGIVPTSGRRGGRCRLRGSWSRR